MIAVDFGDLLLHNLTRFQQDPESLARYQGRFRYVLGYCHIRVILDEVDDATWRKECVL